MLLFIFIFCMNSRNVFNMILSLCVSVFFQLDIEIKRKNVILETFLSEHKSNTEQAISKILLFEIYSSHCFIFEMFIPLLLSPIIYTKKLFHDLDANFMNLYRLLDKNSNYFNFMSSIIHFNFELIMDKVITSLKSQFWKSLRIHCIYERQMVQGQCLLIIEHITIYLL